MDEPKGVGMRGYKIRTVPGNIERCLGGDRPSGSPETCRFLSAGVARINLIASSLLRGIQLRRRKGRLSVPPAGLLGRGKPPADSGVSSLVPRQPGLATNLYGRLLLTSPCIQCYIACAYVVLWRPFGQHREGAICVSNPAGETDQCHRRGEAWEVDV